MLSRPGRVGTEESATYPSLALISLLLTPLVAFQLEQMRFNLGGEPHETFEAWQENIPVSRNVNWNDCHNDVAQT